MQAELNQAVYAGQVDVSVVIACYQCVETIHRSLNSVLQQTQLPVEIILVDDASDDGTCAVLSRLANAYSHQHSIKLIQHDVNRGAGAARNTGWSAAKGAYIAFLDADDSWHPEKLAIQYAWMQQNPSLSLSCHAFGDDFNALENIRSEHIQSKQLLFKNKVLTSTVMLKRSFEMRFDAHQRYSEDYLLWLQLVFSGHELCYLNVALAQAYKPLYGAGGLSRQLLAMQSAELGNYLRLYNQQRISWVMLFCASVFSVVKFIRRLLLSLLRVFTDKR